MGLVTTATFAVLILRSLDLWDLHSVWGSLNWGMQCEYPETRATWEAVPMWYDVTWRGSSLSCESGITILSALLYQGKHWESIENRMHEALLYCSPLKLLVCQKNKASIIQLTFFWRQIRRSYWEFCTFMCIWTYGKYLSFFHSCFSVCYTQQYTIVLHEGKILHRRQFKRKRLLVQCHISLTSTCFCTVLKQGQLKFYIAFPGKCQEARKCNVTSLLILYAGSHRTKGN